MSTKKKRKKGLENGLFGDYKGEINGLVFQQNGIIRINIHKNRKKRRKNV